MADSQYPTLETLRAEHIDHGIAEARHQDTSGAHHAERLAPHRAHRRGEAVGYRMEHEIERGVAQHGQICHVAEDGADGQALARGNRVILGQLRRAVVNHGHPGAAGSEYRPLLPSTGREAQDVGT